MNIDPTCKNDGGVGVGVECNPDIGEKQRSKWKKPR